MKRFIEEKKWVLAIIVLFIIAPLYSAIAQICPPGCSGPTCSDCVDPSTVPLDGGVGFILASGIALGIKKIYHRK
jgi:hypothetical protein